MRALVDSSFPPGTLYVPPRGGFIHWLELPMSTDMAKLQQLAHQQGYHIAGSGIFFADGQPTTGLRLCLGRPLSPELAKGLRVLGECALQSHPDRPM